MLATDIIYTFKNSIANFHATTILFLPDKNACSFLEKLPKIIAPGTNPCSRFAVTNIFSIGISSGRRIYIQLKEAFQIFVGAPGEIFELQPKMFGNNQIRTGRPFLRMNSKDVIEGYRE